MPVFARFPAKSILFSFVLPSYLVRTALEDCAAKPVGAVAVASPAIPDSELEGGADALTRFCRANQVPLLGPNLSALGNPRIGFSCGLVPYLPEPGRVAVIPQSGSNLAAAVGMSSVQGFGISFFVGLGNQADVDVSEVIAYAGTGGQTRSIALYLEGIESDRALLDTCRLVAPRAPIIALKAGISELGRRAAAAHTGSNSNLDEARYDELFNVAGVVRVSTFEELLDGALALALMPPSRGPHAAIVTNGGGSGLLAADELERRGIAITEICRSSPRLQECLPAYVSRFGSCLNPIDPGAAATAANYAAVVGLLQKDRDIGGVLISVCVTSLTNIEEITTTLIEMGVRQGWSKLVVVEVQGGADSDASILRMRRSGIPAYPTPERAAAALSALRRYALFENRKLEERGRDVKV